ncbi:MULTISPECIES: DUF1107 domain-containing protein [Vibrio]|jgi:hypothetical protein|uniref:DUF1107 domain-containing protein n=1 Tax=Vibrio natriegens NBRC 15636 = ATCC 14048 = DSM 759 TaxID=1219067 RepID=A0AAN1CUM9_VIBNA|nr:MULTISPECIES: DUF1107 domain-containing protein [Vibrio]MEE3878705.1 DUF1107 domain-containing protein [Vibrio sp. YYF0003]WMN87588.1 DUF1107 domain-containing protein [Vibrio parahaemolyticus]CAH0528181.1 hypothetical protein CTH30272_01855 [Catenococcus thiocycli]AEX20800.1 hypothetical protein VEJY3_01510 [Vibrio sp. EJY3]ALR16610.1 hypothetical protein PN96_11775 [Vibrio natriegens NBRC 15636 = ATCC 14048 = DSM 759]
MLREFAVYRPLQVARFVKTLFKGQFFIAGVGNFDFDNGKVLLPDVKDQKRLSVFKEVNQEIASLKLR